MYCYACGFFNPEDTPVCMNCGARLITNANPRFGTMEEFDKDNILAQVFSKFENNFSSLFEELQDVKQRMATLEQDTVVLRNGLVSLVELLAQKDLIKQEKFSHMWEDRILSDIQNREERDRFITQKEDILMMYRGRNRKGFEGLIQDAEDRITGGEMDGGILTLERALKRDPKNYRLAFYLGQTFYMRGDLKKSLGFFRKALTVNPDDYECNLYVGLVLNDMGEIEEAVRYLNAAIEISPDFYLPYFTLGTIFYFDGNLRLADFFLDQSLDRERLPEILFFMALVKKDSGQKRKSEKLLLETIETDPAFEDAYYYLGMVYLELGWTKKAREMFEQVLTLNPSRMELVRPPALEGEGIAYVRHNEEILKLLKKCDEYARQREPERAINYCRSLLAVEKDNPLILVHLAMYLADSERLEEAAFQADKILSMDVPESMALVAYSIRHSALKSAGDLDAAVQLSHEIMETYPSDYSRTLCLAFLAMDKAEQGKFAEAEAYGKDGLKISPRELRHHALDALAWVNYRKGNAGKARELLQESLSLSPANPLALYHLGIALLSMRKRREAEQILKKLMELRDEGSPFPRNLIASIREHLSSTEQHDHASTTDPEPDE